MRPLEDGDQRSAPQSPTPSNSSLGTFALPKTRSSGNLCGQPAINHTSGPGRSFSLDYGLNADAAAARSAATHEHGIVPTGLHRIRQQPSPRQSSTPNLSSIFSTMTIQMPDAGAAPTSKPTSPLLPADDDLVRFPSESLHSFSFAEKSNDLQMKNNVLKRSIDLLKNMQDQGTWAAGGLGIATAQAKMSGDEEVQSMLELLSKARLLGSNSEGGSGLGLGPLTGPAQSSSDNVFERSFGGCSGSPEPIVPSSATAGIAQSPEHEAGQTPIFTFDGADEPPRLLGGDLRTASLSHARPRAALKRTYTDVASLSVQNKLTEAMSQPYIADDGALLSPTARGSFDASAFAAPVPGFTSHAHGRNMPLSQAIFTTEAHKPWTITASNDLACLAFGVQKAEMRKLSILDMIREDKRQWLEAKLTITTRGPPPKPHTTTSPPRTSIMGNGVTARLLSKPSSRESSSGRKSKSPVSTSPGGASPRPAAQLPRSNGVLLCGDVVTIQKRNGESGSATLWVQEKRDKFIWVLEEIAEDVAFVSVDEIGCVTKLSGKSEAVWGMEHVRRGMDVTRLIPDMPRLKGTNTGALDYDRIAELRRFTARTSNNISIPVTIDQLSGPPTFRVSSFPHMAGMMVVSPTTLNISSSNVAVSEALFGSSANGRAMTDLIPGFDKMLNVLVEDDQIDLVEGMVIPEHSFRRARALVALREGKLDSADAFLRPKGLPAVHRDGATIMVDVQMRVVKSETFSQAFQERTIPPPLRANANPGIAYAVWVTYSKALHAEHHGIGPVSPLVSRPSTPPRQPKPGLAVTVHEDSESDDATRSSSARTSGTELTPPLTALSKPGPPVSRGSSGLPISPETSRNFRKSMSISDYIILEDMGAGAYGQVKLARPKTSAPAPIRQFSKIVIKYVTKRRILVDTWTRDRKLGTVPLEIHVLDHLKRDGLQHPNIIEMIDFFEDDVNYYILMKPHGLPGMDLFDYIELRVNMEEEECRRIFAQVVSAVQFLHTKARIVHRDIKDENVILDGEGRIKLIDFGSASYLRNGPFDVFVGTIDYAAPEVLTGAFYDGLKQDVWALGILLYTILYKENPFYSIDEIMDHDLRIPFIVSESSIDLVKKMLERDVGKRYNVTDVAEHSWLAGTVA